MHSWVVCNGYTLQEGVLQLEWQSSADTQAADSPPTTIYVSAWCGPISVCREAPPFFYSFVMKIPKTVQLI